MSKSHWTKSDVARKGGVVGFEQTEMDLCLKQYLRGAGGGEDDNEVCLCRKALCVSSCENDDWIPKYCRNFGERVRITEASAVTKQSADC